MQGFALPLLAKRPFLQVQQQAIYEPIGGVCCPCSRYLLTVPTVGHNLFRRYIGRGVCCCSRSAVRYVCRCAGGFKFLHIPLFGAPIRWGLVCCLFKLSKKSYYCADI
nr:MAG TPA: hypothetical protein [Caudoviricetes sp.]